MEQSLHEVVDIEHDEDNLDVQVAIDEGCKGKDKKMGEASRTCIWRGKGDVGILLLIICFGSI